MKEEKIEKEFFDSFGSRYIEDFLCLSKTGSRLVKEWHQSKIISQIQPRKSRILEIGCGTGALMKKIGTNDNIIVGVDISKNLLDEARKEGMNVVLASSTNPPFTDEIFDYLICEDVIHHLPNLKVCLNEFFRVLKNDSRIIIFDPNPDNPFGNIARSILKKVNKLSKTESPIKAKVLSKMLKTSGHSSIEIQYGSIMAFPFSGMVTGVSLMPSWGGLWAKLIKFDEALSWNKKWTSRILGWKYIIVAKKLSD